ncbi:MAG: hypothetical protein P8Z37_03670 [Acidobacteriota bacterium]|jgi:hypothetical protein
MNRIIAQPQQQSIGSSTSTTDLPVVVSCISLAPIIWATMAQRPAIIPPQKGKTENRAVAPDAYATTLKVASNPFFSPPVISRQTCRIPAPRKIPTSIRTGEKIIKVIFIPVETDPYF